jgi:hypothetical protein
MDPVTYTAAEVAAQQASQAQAAAQAREAAGAAIAEAQNAAWRNNTGPVLPKYANPPETFTAYDPSGKPYQVSAAEDAANEAAKYAANNSPINYGQYANVPLMQMPAGMAGRVQEYYREHPTPAFQSLAGQYSQEHNAIVSSSGTLIPVNGGFYNVSTGEMFHPSVPTAPQPPQVQNGIGPSPAGVSPIAQTPAALAGANPTGVSPTFLVPFVNAGNRFFGSIPILGDINKAGRIFGLEGEIKSKSEDYQNQYSAYEKAGVISQGPNGPVFLGSQGQYTDLVSKQNEIGVLQGQENTYKGQLTGNLNPAGFWVLPGYSALLAASGWSGDVIGKNFGKLVAPLTESTTGKQTTSWIEQNRMTLAVGMPLMGVPGLSNLIPDTPAKLSEASQALVGVPGKLLTFGGMALIGGEMIYKNPATLPALAVAGLYMQGQGAYEGITTRPTGFVYEQLGMILGMEFLKEGIVRASPIGGGILDVPSFDEKGSPTRFYTVYTKTPFAAEGGEPMFMAGVAKTPGNIIGDIFTGKQNWVTRTPIYTDEVRTTFIGGSEGRTDIIPENIIIKAGENNTPFYDEYSGRTGYKIQSPVGFGRIEFAAPEGAQMGFAAVRSPVTRIESPTDFSFGAGYFRTQERTSFFIGSPSERLASMVSDEGWMYEKQHPLEFERGNTAGFTPAEKFVLEPILRNTAEWNMIENTRVAQNYLVSSPPGSTVTQKTPYAYRPSSITPEAWNAFLDVIKKPEYAGRVVLGGSTVAETFVESGKFRPLNGLSDVDIFFDEKIFESLANDIGEAMQEKQGNLSLFGDFEKESGPGMFHIEVENALGETTPVIEGHTFTEFPNVLKQTTFINLEGGDRALAVAPEYSLRSKLAGSIQFFHYGDEGADISYKRLGDFPDVVSISRQMGLENPSKSTMFNKVAGSYEDYLFGKGIENQARVKAENLISNTDWRTENPDTTIDELVQQNMENVGNYRQMVTGFGNPSLEEAPWKEFNPVSNRSSRSIPQIQSSQNAGAGQVPDTSITTRQRGLIGYKTTINWGEIKEALTPKNIHPFIGSPSEILEDAGFKISPNMETMNGGWSNTEHAIFDRYLTENLPEEQARIYKAASPAINAAWSRLFTPQQREAFGSVKTTSASEETISNILRATTEEGGIRSKLVFGGSRAQRVWVGESGRYESLFKSDFDTYATDTGVVNRMYSIALEKVQQEFPNAEEMRGTHPATSPDITKVQASIVTNPKDEFIHIKPFSSYPYMEEGGPVNVEAIGGNRVNTINPRLLFKRSVGGMFSAIEQTPEGTPRLVISRPKDIPAAYAMSRAFAETLYQPQLIDVGGVITRAKVSRAASLEEYSNAVREYAGTLPETQRTEVSGMFKEMRMDILRGVERNPEPVIDIVTGKGWLDRPAHGWNEEAMFMPGNRGSGLIEPNDITEYPPEDMREQTYPSAITRGAENDYLYGVATSGLYGSELYVTAIGYPSPAAVYPNTRPALSYPITLDTGYPPTRILPEYSAGYPAEGKYPLNETYPVGNYTPGGDYPTKYPSDNLTVYPADYPVNRPPAYPLEYPPGYPTDYPPNYPPDYPPNYPPGYPPYTPPPNTPPPPIVPPPPPYTPPPITSLTITEKIPRYWERPHRRKRPARFLELFSFEEGLDSPIPIRFGLGGVNQRATGQRPARFLELFSLEQGTDTGVPYRFGKGGVNVRAASGNPTAAFIPGYRGTAAQRLRPEDIAPNGIFDILDKGPQRWRRASRASIGDRL